MLKTRFATAGAEDGTGSTALLQELNHRVANDYAVVMAILSRGAADAESVHVRTAFTAARDRLYDLAGAHRALQAPTWAAKVELCSYLQSICSATAKARAIETQLTLALPESAITLPSEQAWRIGLIVSELITNAVKHGQLAGEIRVEVGFDRGELVCSVRNRGCMRPRNPVGAGSSIVAMLAAEIGGRAERYVVDDWVIVDVRVAGGDKPSIEARRLD